MATEEARAALSNNRKRRGVVRSSLTRIETRVAELEAKGELSPGDRLTAQTLSGRLENLDSDFKAYHFAIVDLVEDPSTEQEVIDNHDDKMADLTVRINQLTARSPADSPAVGSTPSRRLTKRLDHLDGSFRLIVEAVDSNGPEAEVDSCLFHQHEEQLGILKAELAKVSGDILSLDEDSDGLTDREATLNKSMFDTSVKLKRLLQRNSKKTPPVPATGGVKLPKLDVPTFDGNLINWQSFWEQFAVSVHDRDKLSNAEKLAYLKHALKDGTAKQVVEGLSTSGEQYKEAVDCLKKRFDRPRLLHQAHVKAILDAPALKEGTGKEL